MKARVLTWVSLSGALLFGGNVSLAQEEGVPTRPQNRVAYAHHIDAAITVDGILDEPDWARAEVVTDFIQREPLEGQPATEKTEVRILYDQQAIYFGFTAYESEPDKIIINSLKQDFAHTDSDGVSLYLDTFNDDRNSYAYFINPAGAGREMQAVDEGRDQNIEWEDIWAVKTSIGQEAWFAEVKIPFKSLRFPKSKEQLWGINFQRRIRRKNEQSFWAPMPRRFISFNVSFAGDLKGLEDVSPGRNLKVKPYLSSRFQKLAEDDFDTKVDLGLDVKYSLTPGLTLDVTVNTDFSQVEVDEQQVNLTRFNLFFPEKRDFFLENAGIFVFGRTDRSDASSREFIPFFSRRIGLSSEFRPIPILGGARVTGRAGDYGLGVMNMQTLESGGEPANNFTVVRVKRNIFSQSELGGLFVNRQSELDGDFNRTFGVDANFRFWQNLRISSFLAATRTPGLEEGDGAGRIWVEWRTNLWQARTGYLDIGENFNAEVGFVPRRDIRKSDSSLGWKPRPESISWIREFFPNVRVQYINNQEGELVTRLTDLVFTTTLSDGGSIKLGRTLRFERLDDPFFIRPALEIPHGDYYFDHWIINFRSDPSARISGNFLYETGDFWDGTRTGLDFSVTWKPHYKFTATTRFRRDAVTLKAGEFTSRLVNARLEYSFSTRMFLSAFLQYNSDLRQLSSNLRFNLIHRPLSDIFIVYNESRQTFQAGEVNKSLTFKYTHMLDLF